MDEISPYIHTALLDRYLHLNIFWNNAFSLVIFYRVFFFNCLVHSSFLFFTGRREVVPSVMSLMTDRVTRLLLLLSGDSSEIVHRPCIYTQRKVIHHSTPPSTILHSSLNLSISPPLIPSIIWRFIGLFIGLLVMKKKHSHSALSFLFMKPV